MAAFFYLLSAGKISDPSLIKREDRPLFLGATAVFIFLATITSFFLGLDLYFRVHILFSIFIITLFLITMFFKMSGHVFLNIFFIFILNYLSGWNLGWLFLVVPFVAYARLRLKAHTPAEVLAGAAVGIGEAYFLHEFIKLV